jgi:DNA-binding MarR family transcriptional regulator
MTDKPAPFAPRVAQLIDRLARVTRELQFCDGLNPAQWEAMRFISRANRYSCSPSGLAEFLGTTKGTASQTLISLEGKGLIARTRGEVDKRQVSLTLTAKGEELLQCDPIVGIEQAAEKMSAELGEPLVRGLTRLLHDLQNRHGIKEFGVCADCTLNCVNLPMPTDAECSLTGDKLSPEDSGRICVNFRSTAAE